MKLSELVKLKLAIQQISSIDIGKTEANHIKTHMESLLTDEDIAKSGLIDSVTHVIDRHISELNSDLRIQLARMVANIDASIQPLAAGYFARGYDHAIATVDDDRKNRQLPLPNHIKSILVGRINGYADWHYPGMEIGPHDGEFTDLMVGCDPLYLVDVHHEYLDSTMAKFNAVYQARLRTYYIGHGKNEKGLIELPQNQFGFIFSWNTFNYLPLDDIKRYLFDAFSCLRPGGTFMFSFNDASAYNGARHVEWGGMSYTPKDLLVAIAEGHGFELTAFYGFETDWHNVSWLELKKPGHLETIKAHQTLGEIRDID